MDNFLRSGGLKKESKQTSVDFYRLSSAKVHSHRSTRCGPCLLKRFMLLLDII